MELLIENKFFGESQDTINSTYNLIKHIWLTYEKKHRENQRRRWWRISFVVEVVELKFSEHHDKYLQQRLAGILKLLALVAIVDDEEGEAEGNDHDEESEGTLHNPLRDGVEHDAKPAAQAGVAAQHEDQLQPGQADPERGHNLVHLDVGLEGERGDGEGVDEQVAPVLHLPKVAEAEGQALPGLLAQLQHQAGRQQDLHEAERYVRKIGGHGAATEGLLVLLLALADPAHLKGLNSFDKAQLAVPRHGGGGDYRLVHVGWTTICGGGSTDKRHGLAQIHHAEKCGEEDEKEQVEEEGGEEDGLAVDPALLDEGDHDRMMKDLVHN